MRPDLVPFVMRQANRARHAWWRLTRAKVDGVHGIALTPAGRIVLVTLSYAPGWRVPGGAKRRRETAQAGMLRELREEIGLLDWTEVEAIGREERRDQGWVERDSLFVVHGVAYRPRRSLEIRAVADFALDALPADLSPVARTMIAALPHRTVSSPAHLPPPGRSR